MKPIQLSVAAWIRDGALVILPLILSACLIIEVDITESVETGGTVMIRIVVQEDIQEQSTPWRGVEIVLVPDDWSFVSGVFAASDMNGAVGSGALVEAPPGPIRR